MISRAFVMLYSLACYTAGLAALLYAIGFVGDFVVPKTINSGPVTDWGTTLAYDLPLLTLFALQHSVMARQGFKRWWTRFVPKAAERATYVLAAAAALGLLYWLWQPQPTTVWQVTNANAAGALTGLYLAGWAIVFISTFLINHFELMGLEQSFANLRGKEVEPPHFRTPLFYKLVRHPIYTGLLIVFWATPHMTQGHLLFALATTGYIFVGIAFEERDLVSYFGDAYRDYRRTVPMVIPIPRLGRRDKARETA
jgi:protein-S-isoprenylcysteine O-methyltransferase Ste14